MNDRFKIRLANDRDADAISFCVNAAYQHYVKRIGKLPGPMLENYEKTICDDEVYIATKRNQPKANIHGVLVLKASSNQFLLDNIAVHPDTQGRGVGKQLITLAEQRAVDLGYDRIRLYTHEQMHENIQIYPKLGYKESHRITEHGFERIYFEKVII